MRTKGGVGAAGGSNACSSYQQIGRHRPSLARPRKHVHEGWQRRDRLHGALNARPFLLSLSARVHALSWPSRRLAREKQLIVAGFRNAQGRGACGLPRCAAGARGVKLPQCRAGRRARPRALPTAASYGTHAALRSVSAQSQSVAPRGDVAVRATGVARVCVTGVPGAAPRRHPPHRHTAPPRTGGTTLSASACLPALPRLALLCASSKLTCRDASTQEAPDVSREASTEQAEASRERLKLLERRLQLRRLYRKVLLAQALLGAERCELRRRTPPTRRTLTAYPLACRLPKGEARDDGSVADEDEVLLYTVTSIERMQKTAASLQAALAQLRGRGLKLLFEDASTEAENAIRARVEADFEALTKRAASNLAALPYRSLDEARDAAEASLARRR